MIKIIWKKELLEQLTSRRFIYCTLIIVSLIGLLWDQDKKLWRHLEVFYSPGVGETYFFDLL